MDDDDFVTQYVVNIDPDDPPNPRGCWGWFMAIVALLGTILAYCLI
ncbi:MAG: hypothetical protein AB7O59_21090 [Pirellulales bacterium]